MLEPSLAALDHVEDHTADWDPIAWGRWLWANQPQLYESLPTSSPTDFEPGSPAKMKILAERARRREALHHPHDRQLGPDQLGRPAARGRNGALAVAGLRLFTGGKAA